MTVPISLSSNIKFSSEILAQEVDSETVLLDLRSENYFGLDEVGTRIWQLLQEHKQLQSVFDIMLQEYDVDEKQLQDDLNDLLAKLIAEDLITLEPTIP